MKDVYELANDSVVRQNSFNSNEIKYDDHIKWYLNKINNKDCIFLYN